MIFWEVFGAIFGLMIIGAWYMETYLDTTFSSNSRIITSRMSSSARSQATTRPLVGLGFFICSLGNTSYKLGFHYVMTGILTAVGILCFLVAAIYHFFPLPVPRWADARYQYMKRHGMLDENGDPIDFDEEGSDPPM
ncbi:MAG: hypothetical protein E7C13_06185 [Actinomyces sp.]|nr:hypothetical protein [Actinomyces sp.]